MTLRFVTMAFVLAFGLGCDDARMRADGPSCQRRDQAVSDLLATFASCQAGDRCELVGLNDELAARGLPVTCHTSLLCSVAVRDGIDRDQLFMRAGALPPDDLCVNCATASCAEPSRLEPFCELVTGRCQLRARQTR